MCYELLEIIDKNPFSSQLSLKRYDYSEQRITIENQYVLTVYTARNCSHS